MRKFLQPFCLGLLLCIIQVTVKAQQQVDTSKHYADEKPASFPGGIDGWRRYLEGNLQYPKKAYKKIFKA